MAAKNWKDNLTAADWANWRAAQQQFLDREAELWARIPHNRNLAQGIYGQGPKHVSNAERGFLSPLGGQAVETGSATQQQKK